jgi:hypothetical protein
MRKSAILIAILGLSSIISGCSRGNDPLLKGSYLGQDPPGIEPRLFAPDVVSTEAGIEFAGCFSPDGMEYYFTRRCRHRCDNRILFTRYGEKGWSTPAPAPFASFCFETSPRLSPDGLRLIFGSRRPRPDFGALTEKAEAWMVERTPAGWGVPHLLGAPFDAVNTACFSASLDGTVYTSGLRRSRLEGNRYGPWEPVGPDIEPGYCDRHPFVAPDGSFLLFDSSNRPGGFGKSDLYVSFRREDGSWTRPRNLGGRINTGACEMYASVSPEGCYLFYHSRGDILWVDARVLDALRPGVRIASVSR